MFLVMIDMISGIIFGHILLLKKRNPELNLKIKTFAKVKRSFKAYKICWFWLKNIDLSFPQIGEFRFVYEFRFVSQITSRLRITAWSEKLQHPQRAISQTLQASDSMLNVEVGGSTIRKRLHRCGLFGGLQ